MKVSLILLSFFTLVACRAPQARTSAADPAQASARGATDDPALMDGAPATDEKSAQPLGEGYASWYGKELQGRPTASGEMFDMNKMTAAHRDYPMNSLVLVKNVENGKKVMVKVNDRGPYVDGRIMDVSYAAARELGFAEKGTTKVQLELIQAGENDFMAKAGGAPVAKAKKKPAKEDAEEEILEPVAAKEEASEDSEEDDGKIKSAGSKKEKLVFLDGKKPKGFTVQVGAFKKKENAERHRDEILESYPQKGFIATNGKWHFICIGDFKTRKQAKDFLKKLNEDGIDVMYRGKVS